MHRFSKSTTRRGFSLIEMMIVIVLVGVLSAVSIPFLLTGPAKASVHGATSAIASYHAIARNVSIGRGRTAVLVIHATTPPTMLVIVKRPGSTAVDTVAAVQDLYSRFSVALTTTSDSVIFTPRGVGVSASTTTIIASRAGAADTLRISAAGRLIR